MKIVLATSNPGKVKEITELLRDIQIEVIAQSALNIPDAAETGTTFYENAIIKARNAAKLSGLPALADDSGLSIQALNGAPGVYSSRYAGEDATDQDRIQKVLHELIDVPMQQRQASFHCVMAFMRSADDPAPILCHGEWSGLIATEAQGQQGFGYDPIFHVPTHHCTAAELDPSVKNQISHRACAFELLRHAMLEAGYQ